MTGSIECRVPSAAPTPVSPAPVSSALSAFLRGIERRAFVFVQVQCGRDEVAQAALGRAMRAFREISAHSPLSAWPAAFWALLVAQAELAEGERLVLDVVVDRFRMGADASGADLDRPRVIEALEVAFKRGNGHVTVYALSNAGDDAGAPELWRFSSGLHCPESHRRYSTPTPGMFSFNSAAGACPTCRGFGRVIGVDYGLVIPNDKLTLRAGAIKTIQTPAWKEAQDDLMRHAETAGIPRDTPWYKLTDDQKKWVIGGAPGYKDGQWSKQWYGIKRFFEYLESKAYKMHIRVLLSKYRSYTPCPTCAGARLKTESLLWRIGRKEDADAVLEPGKRFMPEGVQWSREQLEALPGLCLHDLMLLPIDRLRQFFARMQLPVGDDAKGGDAQALKLLHEEITTRLKRNIDAVVIDPKISTVQPCMRCERTHVCVLELLFLLLRVHASGMNACKTTEFTWHHMA